MTARVSWDIGVDIGLDIAGISWGYRGDTVEVLWGYRQDIVGILWGYITKIETFFDSEL